MGHRDTNSYQEQQQMKKIHNPFTLWRMRRQRKLDAKVSEVYGYSQGYMACNSDNMKVIKYLQEEMVKLSQKVLGDVQNLHEEYQKKHSDMESLWTQKCTACHKGIEQEKTRLVSLQKDLLDAIQNFSDIYNKLIRYFSVMDMSYDTLIKNLGRIQSSQEYLEGIKDQADDFIKLSQKLLNK